MHVQITYDIMSASELGRAELSHNERRMAITNEIRDIMSVSKREQAEPVHRERRMTITGIG